MLYFTSDIHFNDYNTLKNDNRPFKNTKQFDKHVIKTWNKQAKKEDTIYVIGDFMDCDGANHDSWKKSILYVKKIKAKVILILGNNENRVIKYFFNGDFNSFKNYCLKIGFQEVHENLTISFKNHDFYLIHKPKDHKKNILNLFGHIHRAGGLYKSFGFNIGCDNNHFRLYSEDDVMHLIDMREKYWLTDINVNLS